jgi:hypothetical protein
LTDRRTLTCLSVYPQPSTLCVAFSGRAGPTARSELPHANRAAADPSSLALALAADSTSSLTFGQGRLRYRPSILGPRPCTQLSWPGSCRRAAQGYLQPSFLCLLWPPPPLQTQTPLDRCVFPLALSPPCSAQLHHRLPLTRISRSVAAHHSRVPAPTLQNCRTHCPCVLQSYPRPQHAQRATPARLTLPYLRSTQLLHFLTTASSSAAVPERIIRFDISGLQRLRQSRVFR